MILGNNIALYCSLEFRVDELRLGGGGVVVGVVTIIGLWIPKPCQPVISMRCARVCVAVDLCGTTGISLPP